jgi:hypothetical protein
MGWLDHGLAMTRTTGLQFLYRFRFALSVLQGNPCKHDLSNLYFRCTTDLAKLEQKDDARASSHFKSATVRASQGFRIQYRLQLSGEY